MLLGQGLRITAIVILLSKIYRSGADHVAHARTPIEEFR